ncbi:hypothetical protein B5M50_07015 [candidate division KSB1 bacterium 4484_219]|nr:MAG: hypothetical protein B5M50_07015 [candidate division KSB1 bacterium 4484_219]
MNNIEKILRRALFSLITLGAVITFNFYLFRIVPGDPVSMIASPRMKPETREKIREQYGLNKPIWINLSAAREEGQLSLLLDSQFFHYLNNLAHAELGQSFRQKSEVAELIGERLYPTILLILTGELMGILFGTLLGVIAAWKARSKIDAGGQYWFLEPMFW